MHKKLTSALVVIALLASPVIVSAQTTSTSSASIIVTLEQLVATLTSELQALIAARRSSSTVTTPITSTNSTQSLVGTYSCSTFSNLQKGDTDATTGGEVSQLQSFLGINPTTGYYGAQTSIAYNKNCFGGNTQSVSVAETGQYGVFLTATPSSGAAPMKFEFQTGGGSDGNAAVQIYSIDFGDKTQIETFGDGPGNSCGDPNEFECGHTYTTPGTYVAHVYSPNGTVLSAATVTVTG